VSGALARGALGSSPNGDNGAVVVVGTAAEAVGPGVAGRVADPAHAVASNRATMTARRGALIPLLLRARRGLTPRR
ncbi:MAG TPA: hypothetical protein VIY56_05305, partial [Vicinamibacterales bacterium]